MSRRRNLVIGLGLALASVLFGFIMLEVFLRLTIENEADLYVNLTYNPSLNTIYWEKSFIHLYSSKKEWQRGEYDPFLGWDRNIENGRIRGSRTHSLLPEEDVLRVVAIGDSFTFGAQVADDETYSAYLEEMLENSEVLNMGVVAYGIDQAALKYIRYGSQYKPNWILFGILPDDYHRVSVPFYSFSKPTFTYNDENNSVELTNTNIPPPQEVYDELNRKLDPPILYSYAFLKNRLVRAYWKLIDSGAKEQYYEEMDIIVEHILTELVESAQETGTRLLVVQIPNGHVFRNQETLEAAMEEPTRVHLLDLYEKLGITYIDLQKEFRDRFPLGEVFQEFYFPKPEASRGHFTPRGNLETANIIKAKLEVLP